MIDYHHHYHFHIIWFAFTSIRVVIYTQQDVYSIFPGMKNLGGIVTLSYHDHCIYTVVKAWERRNGKSFAGHLWVLEDDVEFTASWSRLFDKYREYDFVAHRFSTYDRNWQKNHQYFGKQISPKFRSEFLMGLGYQSYVFILEHVVKYSPAFLAKVFELLENGYHARSEIGTGTFATRLNFTWSRLHEVQKPWYCTTHCCDHKCMAAIARLRKEGEGRIFHPVKL